VWRAALVVTISIFFIALPDNLNEILGRAVLTVNTIEKIANQISSQQKVQSDDRHIDLSEFSTETILAKE